MYIHILIHAYLHIDIHIYMGTYTHTYTNLPWKEYCQDRGGSQSKGIKLLQFKYGSMWPHATAHDETKFFVRDTSRGKLLVLPGAGVGRVGLRVYVCVRASNMCG